MTQDLCRHHSSSTERYGEPPSPTIRADYLRITVQRERASDAHKDEGVNCAGLEKLATLVLMWSRQLLFLLAAKHLNPTGNYLSYGF